MTAENQRVHSALVDNGHVGVAGNTVANHDGIFIFVVYVHSESVTSIFVAESAAKVDCHEPKLAVNHDDSHFAELFVLEDCGKTSGKFFTVI